MVNPDGDFTVSIGDKVEHRVCLFRVRTLSSYVFLLDHSFFWHSHLNLHLSYEFGERLLISISSRKVVLYSSLTKFSDQYLKDRVLLAQDIENLKSGLKSEGRTDRIHENCKLNLSFFGVVSVLHVVKHVLPEFFGKT